MTASLPPSATSKWQINWRKTLFWSGLGALGVWASTRYLQNKIDQLKRESELQRLARENIRKRFDQNQLDSSLTVLSLLGGGLQLATERQIAEVERLISLLSAGSVPLDQQQQSENVRKSPTVTLERRRSSNESDSTTPTQSRRSSVAGGRSRPGSPTNPLTAIESEDNFTDAVANQDADNERELSNFALISPVSPTSPITKEEKLKIWSRIRNLSLTNAISHLYFISLLTLLTRVQMNLIGRHVYLASVDGLRDPVLSLKSIENLNAKQQQSLFHGSDGGVAAIGSNGYLNFEDERDFLALSWHFIHIGTVKVVERIQETVQRALAKSKLTDRFTMTELLDLFSDIRSGCGIETEELLDELLLPADENLKAELASALTGAHTALSPTSALADQLQLSDTVTAMIHETRQYLKSTDSLKCLHKTMETCTSLFIGECMTNDEPRAMVSIVPRIHKLSEMVLNAQPNGYLKAVDGIEQLNAFSAIIYSAFEHDTISIS